MVDTSEIIPNQLRSDLEALRPILERQGVVQFRHDPDRSGTYRLRFREFNSDAGFTLHRSVSLGRDPAIGEAVAVIIRHWQDEFQPHKGKIEQATVSTVPENPPQDIARDAAQALCGGGWRRREQVGAWYDKALNDPAEMMRFNITGAFPAVRKGGRPLKHKTW